MNRCEFQATWSLGGILACRMLGLFMILPVFSVYAQHLPHATPLLLGLSLGIYGLTQALLQLPFGALSDKYGRKPLITIGLIIFAGGSLIAAFAGSIYGIIIGRALQGAGAIGSTLMATLSDLTEPNNRSKAMALMGMIIGLSFALAMVTGPLLGAWIHIPGIFLLSFVMALLGLILLYKAVPLSNILLEPQKNPISVREACRSVLTDLQLIRLNLSIFIQHAILTSTFVVLPILFSESLKISAAHQGFIYLFLFFISFIVIFPIIRIAEKYQKIKLILLIAVAFSGVAQWGLWHYHSAFQGVFLALGLYFIGFNLLEALLPSIISKIVLPAYKGTALGVYSSAQFLGIFFGGVSGGWLYGHYYISAVLYLGLLLSVIWLLLIIGINLPSSLNVPLENSAH